MMVGKEFSDDWIGPSLDAGLNTGSYMGNVVGMQMQGMTDKQSRRAATTLANAFGDMQMGRFDAANDIVANGMGYIDYDDIEMYNENPADFFVEMEKRTADMTPQQRASFFRGINMEGANRISSANKVKTVADLQGKSSENSYRNVQTTTSSYAGLKENAGTMALNSSLTGLTKALSSLAVGVNINLTSNGVVLTTTNSNGQSKTQVSRAEATVK
jgi:hypothetical protein